jgi:hypothetical protein
MLIICRTDKEALDKLDTQQSRINESIALAALSDASARTCQLMILTGLFPILRTLTAITALPV